MNYNTTKVVNYLHHGESAVWHNIEVNDCTDEELAEILAVVVRVYSESCRREMEEEKEWEIKRQQEKVK